MALTRKFHCSIELVEPVIYVRGFDITRRPSMLEEQGAMLRGRVILIVEEPVRLKRAKLKFSGKAKVSGSRDSQILPPGHFEEKDTFSQTWVFFDRDTCRQSFTDCTFGEQKTSFPESGSSSNDEDIDASPRTEELNQLSSHNQDTDISFTTSVPKQLRRRSLQLHHHHHQEINTTIEATSAQGGTGLFRPGIYLYPFEFSVPSTCPESINVPEGNVSYQIEAIVERIGVLSPTFHYTRPVVLVRTPHLDAIVHEPPMIIERTWKDELWYSISIPKKSFAIGTSIPIVIETESISDVRCHSVLICVTEKTRCSNRLTDYEKPWRRVILIEQSMLNQQKRRAQSIPDLGSEAPSHQNHCSTNSEKAQCSNEGSQDISQNSAAVIVVSTKLEVEAALPTCRMMRQAPSEQQLHFDTSWKEIEINHWLVIVLRAVKPENGNLRLFEIPVEVPIRLLCCLAAPARTFLPAYADSIDVSRCMTQTSECGCSDARPKTVCVPDLSSNPIITPIPKPLKTSKLWHCITQVSRSILNPPSNSNKDEMITAGYKKDPRLLSHSQSNSDPPSYDSAARTSQLHISPPPSYRDSTSIS